MKLDRINNLSNILNNNSFTREIAQNQRLFRKGDRADDLYTIVRGRFQEISYPERNKMAVLQILKPGEVLGETSLFFNTYRSTAIAQTDSQVIAYPKSILLAHLAGSPQLIEAVIEILCQKIYDLQMRLEWRNISLADRRVLQYLKDNLDRLSDDNNGDPQITLNAPLQEIAAELGFVPATLSRALTKLETDRLITRQQNRITIHNTDAA